MVKHAQTICRVLIIIFSLKPLSANPTKWSNTLKQFVGKMAANCLSVFNHFVGLALKGLKLELQEGALTQNN